MTIDKYTQYVDRLLQDAGFKTDVVGGIEEQKDGAIMIDDTNTHIQVGVNGNTIYTVVISVLPNGLLMIGQPYEPVHLVRVLNEHFLCFGVRISEQGVFVGRLVHVS